MAFNVSGLTAYVQENKDMLLTKAILEGDTIAMAHKQLGIKTKERIHYLDLTPVFQDGSACGFSANGSTNFTEREIETAAIKINDQWCDKDLLGKYAEYLVRFTAGQTELNFEQEIMALYRKKIAEALEKAVWVGDKSSADANLNKFDGFVTIAEGADSGATITASTSTADTIYDKVKKVYKLIPEAILDKAVIFVSPADFRDLGLDLVENFKYNSELIGPETKDILLPGTNTKVHKTMGLSGSHKIYAADPENMFVGADLMNDSEVLKVWFSDDNDVFRLKVEFNLGVQTAFPDMVVLYA